MYVAFSIAIRKNLFQMSLWDILSTCEKEILPWRGQTHVPLLVTHVRFFWWREGYAMINLSESSCVGFLSSFLCFYVDASWFITRCIRKIQILWLLEVERDLLRYILVCDFMRWLFLYQVFLVDISLIKLISGSYERLSSWWEKD
jgi:hypothetical protein